MLSKLDSIFIYIAKLDIRVGIMNIDIKELRRKMGISQSEFSGLFGIPLSTLRKWEQGIASPPEYVLRLIARSVPAADDYTKKVIGMDGNIYYYDEEKSMVMDSKGNGITIRETLNGVNPNNLRIYITDLFDSFYEIRERFEKDCRYDKEEGIEWV